MTTKGAFTDPLIISRLHQKEVSQFQSRLVFGFEKFPLFHGIELDPVSDNLPIDLGFKLRVLGNEIVHIAIERNFFKSGLEQSLTNLNCEASLRLLAGLNRNHSIFYQLPYLLALEQLMAIEVSDEEKKRRSIALEFSRVSHHLSVIKSVFTHLNLDTLIAYIIEIENNLKSTFDICKMVPTKNIATPLAISYENVRALIEDSLQVARHLEYRAGVDATLKDSLLNKAAINLQSAGSYGLSGLFLRANSNSHDLRKKSTPGLHYPLPIKSVLRESGCAYGRLTLRIDEILQTLSWLKDAVTQVSQESLELSCISVVQEYTDISPKTSVGVGEIEGHEGDTKITVFYHQQSGALSFRLRSPAFYIAQAIPHLLKKSDLKDLPLILTTLGINGREVDK